MEKKRSNLSRLFDYAGNYKYLTRAAQFLSAVSALMALVPFIYIWLIIKEVLDVAPDFSQAVNIVHYGWLAVIYAVGSMLIYCGGLLCSHLSAFRIAANIRKRSLRHIITLPLGFMDNFGTGKLRKIINESCDATETFLAHELPDKAGSIATPIGMIALLLYFDWKMGLLCLIPVALGFIIMSTMMLGKALKKSMEEYQAALDNMTNEAVEYVRGIPVVKTFGQSILSFKRFKDAIDKYGRWTIEYTKGVRGSMILFTTLINSVFAILIAITLYNSQTVTDNEFLLNLLYYIIITPVISVTMTKVMYASEQSMVVEESLSRIDSVMNMKPLSQAEKPQHPVDNSIDVNSAVFRYDDAIVNAIDGVSVSIKAGEHVAFVGPSGGGKTTLASLLVRFWDLTSGTIQIGGVDVRNISKEEMTKIVSFVFQDSKLIKGTILENVLLAKPDATREEVLKALHDAQCDDILEKMPHGIDTFIGTGGVYLSGGEQQRVSIARVMLRNTPIIILDEATAFADPDNEAKVQEAFSVLSKGKTMIMIAHRLSTVVSADRIFVLKEGKIAESGIHSGLVADGKIYSKMWNDYCRAAQWTSTNVESK